MSNSIPTLAFEDRELYLRSLCIHTRYFSNHVSHMVRKKPYTDAPFCFTILLFLYQNYYLNQLIPSAIVLL